MSASPKFDPNPLGPATPLPRFALTGAPERPSARLIHAVACRRTRRRPLFGRTLRLRPGRHFGRANGHQVDVRAASVPRRGRDKLGYVGRSSWRARGRRTRGQHRPQAHRADCRRVVHPGAAVQAFAPVTMVLVAGRLIIGAGVGVAAVAAPLYAAELAPASWRGRFVSSYQLAITIGIFLAYLVDGWLSSNDDWRMMLGAAAVPGLLLFCAALIAPESPRWLTKMHRREDAAREMKKVAPAGGDVETDLTEIATALSRRTNRGLLERRLSQRVAPPAHGRAGTCNLPAGNGHQRHHLLRRPDFRRGRLRHRGVANDGDDVGDWRGERVLHPDRNRIHRSPGSSQTSLGRADRHGRQPHRRRRRVSVHRCAWASGEPPRRVHPARAGQNSSRSWVWSRSSSRSRFRSGRWFGP